MTGQRPTVGRVVHYVSYGTPGGEYQSQCRAAIVTEVDGPQPGSAQVLVGLAILNPTGMFFNQHCPQQESNVMQDGVRRWPGGTWHWPEREPEQ